MGTQLTLHIKWSTDTKTEQEETPLETNMPKHTSTFFFSEEGITPKILLNKILADIFSRPDIHNTNKLSMYLS